MKTWNLWKHSKEAVGPTGPWQFMAAVLAQSEEAALSIARMRYGLDGVYKAYEGL